MAVRARSPAASRTRATPKSPSLTSPVLVRKTFWLLTSRCTMCLRWMCCKALAHCNSTELASSCRKRCLSGCLRLMAAPKSPPSAYSMMMTKVWASTKLSQYATMLMCESAFKTSTSFSAVLLALVSIVAPNDISLATQKAPLWRSRTKEATPKEPRPSTLWNSNLSEAAMAGPRPSAPVGRQLGGRLHRMGGSQRKAWTATRFPALKRTDKGKGKP
mmetsp:Transcript_149653/g.480469  ORF Transcript_149653/g.480469 Transcript_149653/m.480469 type:complete len:217 (+) Transcript_149653:1116-1766(+)